MNLTPLFGPGGNSESFYAAGYKHTNQAPQYLDSIGLCAYEYQGGNGIRGSDAAFAAVGEAARKYNITMSLHAPYYISLSGVERETRLKSVDYIRQSLAAAALIGADRIVVHTGSAAKISRGEAMALAADTLAVVLDSIGDCKIKIGLETMGKQNQLGTLDEVLTLCKIDARLIPVVDFGHLNARQCGEAFRSVDDFVSVFDRIGEVLGDEIARTLHCHFSRIEWTAAGEKKHLTFADTSEYGPDFHLFIEAVARLGVAPRVICESAGTMAEDALAMQNYFNELKGAK